MKDPQAEQFPGWPHWGSIEIFTGTALERREDSPDCYSSNPP